jgi:HrpA-like RNA helicase
VGRTSDGCVYRIITKELYEKLDDFDTPEIKCVSLDMAILRAKQIDKNYHSHIFNNPFEIFCNAIEPPEFREIHDNIEYLLKEEALQLVTEENNNAENNQLNG